MFVSKKVDATQNQFSPVAIGGVGGSGTRLVAQILKELGVFMGDDLNRANDNLNFTFLFKRAQCLSMPDNEFRQIVDIFITRMAGSETLTEFQIEIVKKVALTDPGHHNQSWRNERLDNMLSNTISGNRGRLWSWKEPNTHIFIDRLQTVLPSMKYIHVIRNGLDMAHSKNRIQLRFWDRTIMGRNVQNSPSDSLAYWCESHKQVLKCREVMGGRLLFLNYDQLCLDSANESSKLFKFLEIEVSGEKREMLLQEVRPPRSIGRFRQHSLHIYDSDDIQFVKKLGFDITH